MKYFLNIYRALFDGKSGIEKPEQHLKSSVIFLSDWKVLWIGACTLFRTSVDPEKIDAMSGINEGIRNELRSEWQLILENKREHPISWKFLQRERNNAIHEYERAAYEVWMDQDGTTRPARMSLLDIKPQNVRWNLVMRGGHHKGQDPLDLLNESAEWVQERIFGAIIRAGFSPDEKRNLISFRKRPTMLRLPTQGTLSGPRT